MPLCQGTLDLVSALIPTKMPGPPLAFSLHFDRDAGVLDMKKNRFVLSVLLNLLLLSLTAGRSEAQDCRGRVQQLRASLPDSKQALELFYQFKNSRGRSQSALHREALIRYLYPLAQAVGRRYSSKRGLKGSDDFVQDAAIGMMRAIDTFDPNRGEIISYVAKRAFGAIIDQQRQQDWVPRHVRHRMKQLSALKESYIAEFGPSAIEETPFEDFVRARIDDPDLANLIIKGQLNLPGMFNSSFLAVKEDGSHSTENSLAIEDDSYQLHIIRDDVWNEIARGLDETNRTVFELYFKFGAPYREIARTLGISETRVGQRVRLILDLIKLKFTDRPELMKDLHDLAESPR